MRSVQEQPVKISSEYKDIISEVDELMAKINSTKLQHQEEIENPTPSKPKVTTNNYSRNKGFEKYGYPIIYCHTHDIRRNLTHSSMN